MSIHPHGGHSWMQMGLGDYKWGLVCENEARSAADGHCESWVHARIGAKDKKNKIWRGGARAVSRVTCARRGHAMRAKAPHKNKQKKAQAKK